jgi:surface polysaccharide O-acyltransferase-like enzyme
MLLVAACTWLPNTPDPVTKRLAPLMLGIYTLHLFIYRGVVGPLLHQLAVEHSAPLRVVATFIITAAVVACLKRGPLWRVL